jgi:phosphatidylethanolamine-binding protein (PEBP) family uncharacterized protein
VAQRTGAKHLLASLAQSASARALLALALAALCLAGCGGSGGSANSATEPEGSAAAPAKSGGEAGAADGGAAAKPGKASGEGAKKASAHADPSSSPSSSPAGEGSRLPQPKGAPEKAPTPQEVANSTVADMSLQSPAIVAANGEPGRLASTYTCDGKDSWPQLQWSGVPPGSAELALYLMNIQPVEGKLFVDWALAGLDPSLSGIEAGELPPGAISATNSFGKRGYSLCPQGAGETYMFILYALPRRLAPPQGFEPRDFRQEVLAISGNAGLLPTVYERG